MKDLEIYVHIPFCEKKCLYCDFLSGTADFRVRQDYLSRLIAEVRHYGPEFNDYRVVSVFLGGGTPSIYDGHHILRLMMAIRESFNLADDCEISMECNPGTLTSAKAEAYTKCGINRFSLGLQSAHDYELKLLGRIHTYRDFLESYELLRKAGVKNINVDLMSGLPWQTLYRWEDTLKKVVLLKPDHISAYSLQIEEGTQFYSYYHKDEERRNAGEEPEILPSETVEREMYQFTKDFLSAKGYNRYEISNYSLKGKECRHNVGYWTGVSYLGLGLGASSLVDNVRFKNTDSLKAYLYESFCHTDQIVLHRNSLIEEFMFLGLRLTKGISRFEFEKRFSVPIESVYGEKLNKLMNQGYIEGTEGMYRLTEDGINVSNIILSDFLLD